MTDRENPFDPELASELRQTAGKEWAAEAAEDEQLTELHRRRTLSLSDQAAIMVNQRLRVSVEYGGHSFGGAVIGSGKDYATVAGPGQVADIKLEAARWSILPVDQAPPQIRGSDAESFTALLHEYSNQSGVLRLALGGGDMVIGRIEVVASDHVALADVDERRLIVPLSLVLGVVRSLDPH